MQNQFPIMPFRLIVPIVSYNVSFISFMPSVFLYVTYASKFEFSYLGLLLISVSSKGGLDYDSNLYLKYEFSLIAKIACDSLQIFHMFQKDICCYGYCQSPIHHS